MGTLISKKASAEDIMADVRTTLERGRARGGPVATIVDRRLSSVATVVTEIEGERRSLDLSITTQRAARDAANERAKATVNACHDALWNDIGRPAHDVAFATIFPGGAGYYTEGGMDDRAERLDLLVELLGRRLHPRVSAESITAWGIKLTTDRDACRAASEALRGPAARAEQVERAYFAVVRSAHAALGSTKRDLKSDGVTEAEIHEVIPNRPRTREEVGPATPQPNGPSVTPRA